MGFDKKDGNEEKRPDKHPHQRLPFLSAQNLYNIIMNRKSLNFREIVVADDNIRVRDIMHDLRLDSDCREYVERAIEELRWEVIDMVYKGGSARKLRENMPTPAQLKYTLETLDPAVILPPLPEKVDEKDRKVEADDLKL